MTKGSLSGGGEKNVTAVLMPRGQNLMPLYTNQEETVITPGVHSSLVECTPTLRDMVPESCMNKFTGFFLVLVMWSEDD